MISVFIFTGVLSLLSALVLMITRKFHGPFSEDHFDEPQKVHNHSAIRIGGLVILLPFIVATFFFNSVTTSWTQVVLISALPCFVAGFLEDLSNKISPWVRLSAALLSGCLFVFISGISLSGVQLNPLDVTLVDHPLVILVTILLIAGTVNSLNIIDGLNGLAIGISTSIFLFVAVFANFNGDAELLQLSIVLIASMLGISLLNIPFGKVFLGDGGAYLLGACCIMTTLLLLSRHPNVEPMSAFVLFTYIYWELLRSLVRRTLSHGVSPMKSDFKHLHSVVYFSVLSWFPRSRYCNIAASSVCLSLQVMLFICTMSFDQQPYLLCLSAALIILLYEILYASFKRLSKQRVM